MNKKLPNETSTQITKEYLINIYSQLTDNDIQIWFAGGWGVDALLEKQTRSHNNINFVLEEEDLVETLNILKEKDFSKLEQVDSTAWSFNMKDQQGHLIKLNVININDDGDGVHGPEKNHKIYSIEALSGLGKINGQTVRCLTANYQINSRTGHIPSENELHDVRALCEKFSLNLPMRF